MYITVEGKDLKEGIKAFELLFKTFPYIRTCERFNDVEEISVFASCEVLVVKKTKFDFMVDGYVCQAYIKDVDYFTLYND